MNPDQNGAYFAVDDVLAALTSALDPAIADRAGEVLSRLRKADEYEPLGHDGWEAADLITALLAQNAALQWVADEGKRLRAEAEAERDALRAERDAAHALASERSSALLAAEAQIAFTATDGQRLLRKFDVIGVCDDPDFCFDSEGSVARCGPCAVKIAARDGVVLNEYTRSNPQAMRLQRELSAADAKLAEVEKLRGALVEHNDLLRSTFQIAEREGVKRMIASTNWDAFYNRVAVVLKRHYQTANEARAALTTEADNDRA